MHSNRCKDERNWIFSSLRELLVVICPLKAKETSWDAEKEKEKQNETKLKTSKQWDVDLGLELGQSTENLKAMQALLGICSFWLLGHKYTNTSYRAEHVLPRISNLLLRIWVWKENGVRIFIPLVFSSLPHHYELATFLSHRLPSYLIYIANLSCSGNHFLSFSFRFMRYNGSLA